MKTISSIFFLLILFAASACEQSDPPEYWRNGDKVEFSGKTWTVKSGDNLGPGPNAFSPYYSDVFVDEQGRLHLKIAQHEGKWYASEVVCDENTGYGTYVFTVIGDLVNIPENIVLGLFTWDNNTFYEQANSEVDIEFSKWGNADSTNTLTYSVQPVNFGEYYPERTHHPSVDPNHLIGVSTHVFTWTETLISWQSYSGYEIDENQLFAQWSFDTNNPARIKYEGDEQSEPIVIPEPGETTNARINFWILPHISPAPTDEMEHEIMIHSYRYIPLD